MNTRLHEVTETALALPLEERAILADRLIESLDSADEGEPDRKAWGAEIRRRVEEVRSGAVELIDGPTGLEKVRQSLRK